MAFDDLPAGGAFGLRFCLFALAGRPGVEGHLSLEGPGGLGLLLADLLGGLRVLRSALRVQVGLDPDGGAASLRGLGIELPPCPCQG